MSQYNNNAPKYWMTLICTTTTCNPLRYLVPLYVTSDNSDVFSGLNLNLLTDSLIASQYEEAKKVWDLGPTSL